MDSFNTLTNWHSAIIHTVMWARYFSLIISACWLQSYSVIQSKELPPFKLIKYTNYPCWRKILITGKLTFNENILNILNQDFLNTLFLPLTSSFCILLIETAEDEISCAALLMVCSKTLKCCSQKKCWNNLLMFPVENAAPPQCLVPTAPSLPRLFTGCLLLTSSKQNTC